MTRGLTALGHCLWEDPYCFVVQHDVWCKISVPFWSAFPAKHVFIPPHYWSFTAASFISWESLKGLRQLDCAVLQCSPELAPHFRQLKRSPVLFQQTLYVSVTGAHIFLGSCLSLDIVLVTTQRRLAVVLRQSRCITPELGKLPAQPLLLQGVALSSIWCVVEWDVLSPCLAISL